MHARLSHRPVDSRLALWVWLLVVAVLLYTTWAWAGMRPSFHRVTVLASLALALLAGVGGGRTLVRGWLCDPVFWLGLLLLIYLCLPWLNAGRALYYDVGYQRWSYAPPPWPGWPSAFARAEAGQMLRWFWPAWVLVLVVRSPLLDRTWLLRLFLALALSSGLLALFGLIQFLSGTRCIYGVTPLACVFYASFPYANHAAAFFLMTSGLSAGLLFRYFLQSGRPDLSGLPGPLLMAMLTVLSLSRAGALLALLLGLIVLVYGWCLGRRAFAPVDRFRFAAVALALGLMAAASVAAVGGHLIVREFTAAVRSPIWGQLNLDLSGRPEFLKAAWRMWLDHPWWGVGGWGYKYLVSSYLPLAQWSDLARMGWANVHCDPLQYLVEFGLAGAGLLAGALAVLVRAALRFSVDRQPMATMALAGLLMVAVFSLIDLPFRCPAILYTWSVILAALPRFYTSPSGAAPIQSNP